MLGMQKIFNTFFVFILTSQKIPYKILASPGKLEDLPRPDLISQTIEKIP